MLNKLIIPVLLLSGLLADMQPLHNQPTDNNYWAYGNNTFSPPPLTSDGEQPFFNVFYDDNPAPLNTQTSISGVYCSSGTAIVGGSQIPQGALADTVVHCPNTYGIGNNYRQGGQYQRAYETHIYYIENCFSEPTSYYAFSALDLENSARSSDWNRYIEFREWLKKVLYYNLDTLYYCADVNAMIGTVGGWFDSTRGSDKNGAIAIRQYIVESGKCPHYTQLYLEKIEELRKGRLQTWKDTVTNPDLTPLDTTIPTLEDLDLGILRGNLGVADDIKKGSGGLFEFSVLKNPFKSEAELKYVLTDGAVLRLEVLDVLGRIMHSSGLGWQGVGEHAVQVDASSWPQGAYYARLTTLRGEVKTVKLVKEE